MDMYRAFLAILISFVILLGYQYFFIGPAQQEPVETEQATVQPQPDQQPAQAQITAPPPLPQPQTTVPQPSAVADQRPASEVKIDTDLYTATISEKGGVITSFLLKDFREEKNEEAPGVDLVKTDQAQGFPLSFSWGSVFARDTLYTVDSTDVQFDSSTNKATLTLRALSPSGLEVIRTYHFNRKEYLIEHEVMVVNRSGQTLQGSAALHQSNLPFGKITKASNWLFRGPSMFGEAGLQKFKLKEFDEGPQTVQTNIDWVAYEGTYFMTGIIPADNSQSITMDAEEELVAIGGCDGFDGKHRRPRGQVYALLGEAG